MKTYIKEAGYKFSNNANDMIDKQFYLVSVEYVNSLRTAFNDVQTDRVETYSLFLKKLDPEAFAVKVKSIVESALGKGVMIEEDFSVSAENVENGYNITMIFNIKG